MVVEGEDNDPVSRVGVLYGENIKATGRVCIVGEIIKSSLGAI